MTSERDFISSLRRLAADPAARRLEDDAAVLEFGGASLVLTHDMIVEGVHFLADDPPPDVAWKAVAVNLSDLAAKGATPVGLLMGYSLGGDRSWDEAFVTGLAQVLAHYDVPLLGGDTVSAAAGSGGRCIGITAIGRAPPPVVSRGGARAGDSLWVSGSIGDAGAGLRIARGELAGSPRLLDRYRRPQPRLQAGTALAPLAGAMMDVSDGLLIDAHRMAEASGVAASIDLSLVPLSPDLVAATGEDLAARLAAATAGDDYELLFAAPPALAEMLDDLATALGLPLTRVGRFAAGSGLTLSDGPEIVPLPIRLGFEHGNGTT
ncbi:MAG: thiamine-monophosphate kinase [Alphaproteobacteria bacterium]|nr:thiamine-monophosphate kinase [Alphaproteobacteria bacterium]